MNTKVKSKRARLKKTRFGGTVDPTMKSHANDPLVLKKTAEAKAFIDKYGLPKELTRKKKNQ